MTASGHSRDPWWPQQTCFDFTRVTLRTVFKQANKEARSSKTCCLLSARPV